MRLPSLRPLVALCACACAFACDRCAERTPPRPPLTPKAEPAAAAPPPPAAPVLAEEPPAAPKGSTQELKAQGALFSVTGAELTPGEGNTRALIRFRVENASATPLRIDLQASSLRDGHGKLLSPVGVRHSPDEESPGVIRAGSVVELGTLYLVPAGTSLGGCKILVAAGGKPVELSLGGN